MAPAVADKRSTGGTRPVDGRTDAIRTVAGRCIRCLPGGPASRYDTTAEPIKARNNAIKAACMLLSFTTFSPIDVRGSSTA